jgi:hypothetical protein
MQVAHRQAPCDAAPFYGWELPDGAKCAFYRQSSGILIRFPGHADFELSADGASVICTPAPSASDATIEHLFLNQVLPLSLNRLGKLVFHGSAVALEAGAISFLGEAGRGKSTLAAAFATDGDPFLTDDGLVLETGNGRYDVEPTHPSLRLWSDSEEKILSGRAQAAPAVSYTPKARLLAGGMLPHCDQPKPLLGAYFLGESTAEAILIRRLRPGETLIEWARNSFLVDIEDKDLLANHFYRIVELANCLPAFVLDYPRQYDRVQTVLDAIRKHVKTLGQPG